MTANKKNNMKHKIPARKKLTALALTQPKETLPIGEFTNINRVDRYFKVVLKWMEAYDLYNQANNLQLN